MTRLIRRCLATISTIVSNTLSAALPVAACTAVCAPTNRRSGVQNSVSKRTSSPRQARPPRELSVFCPLRDDLVPFELPDFLELMAVEPHALAALAHVEGERFLANLQHPRVAGRAFDQRPGPAGAAFGLVAVQECTAGVTLRAVRLIADRDPGPQRLGPLEAQPLHLSQLEPHAAATGAVVQCQRVRAALTLPDHRLLHLHPETHGARPARLAHGPNALLASIGFHGSSNPRADSFSERCRKSWNAYTRRPESVISISASSRLISSLRTLVGRRGRHRQLPGHFYRRQLAAVPLRHLQDLGFERVAAQLFAPGFDAASDPEVSRQQPASAGRRQPRRDQERDQRSRRERIHVRTQKPGHHEKCYTHQGDTSCEFPHRSTSVPEPARLTVGQMLFLDHPRTRGLAAGSHPR